MPYLPEFKLRTRTSLEEIERATLAPFGKSSKGSHATRLHREREHPYRTAFQRDRDRIIHSRAFRRLKHKRQVFLPSESDHYRTRLTHTLEVAQLSRTMARALGLNEDLVEAIALGHDLGHTPFGHLGEAILNKIMSGKVLFQEQTTAAEFGGFKHNYQSVRVVDEIERKYAFKGLNLTAPVREGMLKHTRLKRGQIQYDVFHYDGLRFEVDMATTLEGQVVALSDEIAQRTHDLEDGIRAGIADINKVRALKIIKKVEQRLHLTHADAADDYVFVGLVIRELINLLVDDVIKQTLKNVQDFNQRKNRMYDFDEELVHFSASVDKLQQELNKFIYREIINLSRVKWSDELGERLLFRLFEAYFRYPETLPASLLAGELKTTSKQLAHAPDRKAALRQNATFFRAICDYIAGMTDAYAVSEARRLAQQHRIKIDDLRLESALGHLR